MLLIGNSKSANFPTWSAGMWRSRNGRRSSAAIRFPRRSTTSRCRESGIGNRESVISSRQSVSNQNQDLCSGIARLGPCTHKFSMSAALPKADMNADMDWGRLRARNGNPLGPGVPRLITCSTEGIAMACARDRDA